MPSSIAKDFFTEAENLEKKGYSLKAVKAYKKAIEADPFFLSAHYNLALLYYQLKQVDNAILHLKKVTELNPTDASAFNNLGVMYFSKNMFKESENCFEKALGIEVYYKEAKKGLEKVRLKLKGKINKNRRLNVGFVSIWFERGQSYVTKTLRDVVAQEHETFVFARTGGVYDRPMLQTDGIWDVPNLTTFGKYEISHEVLGKWIDNNKLDMVVFNEEYDWSLVKYVKEKSIKVVTYLDYYKDDWKPYMYLYDAVLCSTKRTYNLVKNFCNAYYVGWGIDTELFKPTNNSTEKYTFFHNAGWLGINYRKMTPAVILAFEAVSRYLPDATLFIHAQTALEKLPPEVLNIVNNTPRITYHVATVPAPGLYHKGHILVFPSKLEGLGLPLLEGMACGLPAVATDAPPMNEFVQNNYNGLLVKVAKRFLRGDGISFPEEIVDINDLAFKMHFLAKNPELINKMQQNARNCIDNYDTLSKKVNEVINDILRDKNRISYRKTSVKC